MNTAAINTARKGGMCLRRIAEDSSIPLNELRLVSSVLDRLATLFVQFDISAKTKPSSAARANNEITCRLLEAFQASL